MKIRLVAVFAAAFVSACGGGGDGGLKVCPGAITTPASTEPDYAPNFVGAYMGTAELNMNGQTRYATGKVTVTRQGANKLRFKDELDPMIGLVVDADTANLVCMEDKQGQSCGTVTVTYSDGTATMDSGRLDVYIPVVASGCGIYKTGYLRLDDAMPISMLAEDGATAAAGESLMDFAARAIGESFSR